MKNILNYIFEDKSSITKMFKQVIFGQHVVLFNLETLLIGFANINSTNKKCVKNYSTEDHFRYFNALSHSLCLQPVFRRPVKQLVDNRKSIV